MAQWASLCRERSGNLKDARDLLGPCLFAVMMGLQAWAWGSQRVNIHKALVVCSVLCMASFVITAVVPVPAIALMGCALCGLSVSLLWPGMLSMTAASYPSGGVAMFAILAIGGDIGCSVGPQLTGIVADKSSLNWGLLSAIVFPVIMLVGLAALKPMLSRRAEPRNS